jgi:hypothetical protein
MDPDGKSRPHPIAYESKKLLTTEQGYSPQERELLAVKHSLNHWRHFVEECSILVRTDHDSLNFVAQPQDASRLFFLRPE